MGTWRYLNVHPDTVPWQCIAQVNRILTDTSNGNNKKNSRKSKYEIKFNFSDKLSTSQDNRYTTTLNNISKEKQPKNKFSFASKKLSNNSIITNNNSENKNDIKFNSILDKSIQ